jgi:glycine/D-amino acid oxidase-like deaminating enzyme
VASSYWYDALEPEERLALDPGVPTDLSPTPDVLVIGGGAVGVGVAAMCRRAGIADVVVLERGRLGMGATGGAAGLLNPDMQVERDRPRGFVDLCRHSTTLYQRLDAEWKGAFKMRPTLLRMTGDGPRDMLGQIGLNPRRVVATLAAHAGSVATGVEVTGITAAGGRVIGVQTSIGDFRPGAVVYATGDIRPEWSVSKAPRVKGTIVITEPAGFELKEALIDEILIRQLDDGRLLTGSTIDAGDDSPEVRPETVAAIRAEVAMMLPRAANLAVHASWCCFRPGSPDGLPVIDLVPGLTNAWMSVGHFRTGILLALAAGEATAAWITGGTPPPSIAGLGLARLL